MKCTIKLIYSYLFISLFIICSPCHSSPIEDPLSLTTMRFEDQDLIFYQENITALKKAGWSEELAGISIFIDKLDVDPLKQEEEAVLIARGLMAQYGFSTITGSEKEKDAVEYYENAIKTHNSSLARCNLGILLLPEDPDKAQSYFQEAVLANYAPALYYIATSNPNSIQIKQDPDKSKNDSQPITALSETSMRLIRKAIEQDYAPACLFYAEDLIRRGNLSDEEKDSVRKNFKTAVDKQLPHAQYKLATYYAQGGAIFEQDVEKAENYMLLAANQHYPAAQYQLGIWQCEKLTKGNTIAPKEVPIAAREWIEKAASRGHTDAQFFMSKLLLASVSNQREIAVYYMKEAAKKNHPEAICYLAMWYKKGEGVDQDKAKSQKFLKEAAGLGSANAQIELAIIKLHQMPRKFHEAKKLLTLAEQQESPAATYCLGEMYYSGDHKLIQKRDLAKASFYFRSALARDFGAQTSKLKIEKIEAKINKAEKHALKKHPSLHSDLQYAFNLYEENSFEECYELFSGERVRLLSLHMDELLKQGWNTGDTTLIFQISEQTTEPAISNLQAFLKQYGLFNWDKAASIEDAIASYTADDPSAWCHIGILNIDNERFDDAEQLFQKASNKDFPAGHYGLAKCLFYRSNNPGSEQTLKKDAFDLLQKAAKQAFAPAQYSLGCHIMKTELLKLSSSEESSEEQPTHISHWQNIEKATQLISDAADQKFAPAEYTKALLILKGNIFIEKKRKATAKKLIKSAAVKGYAPAMNALGEITLHSMQLLGASLSFNTRAEQLFQRARELGYPPAAYNLGRVYQHGYGVTKDWGQAIKYYQEAVNNDVDGSDKKLKKLSEKTHSPLTEVDDNTTNTQN